MGNYSGKERVVASKGVNSSGQERERSIVEAGQRSLWVSRVMDRPI